MSSLDNVTASNNSLRSENTTYSSATSGSTNSGRNSSNSGQGSNDDRSSPTTEGSATTIGSSRSSLRIPTEIDPNFLLTDFVNLGRDLIYTRPPPILQSPLQQPQEDIPIPLRESEADLEIFDGTGGNPMLPSAPEVTAEEHLGGMDVQGIKFDLLPITRQQYREERLRRYVTFRSMDDDDDDDEEDEPVELKRLQNKSNYFEFKYSRMSEKCAIVHFQLRHLLCAPSKTEIYYTHYANVKRWNPISLKSEVALDISRNTSSVFNNFFRITSLSAGFGLVAAGGMTGELAITRTTPNCVVDETAGVVKTISNDINYGITNYLELLKTRSGKVSIVCANNDYVTRIIDPESFHEEALFATPWAPNCSRLSPDRRIMAICGDSPAALLYDVHSEDLITDLTGHHDFSFALAWSPCGTFVATGNQDKTARIYDLRNTSRALTSFESTMGAIRSLQYSSDGRFLLAAEPADFVHIVDVDGGYVNSQTIDLFGDIGGAGFTPDDETLYIANAYNF